MNRRNFFFGLAALAAIKPLPKQIYPVAPRFHPHAAKAWVRFNGSTFDAYNIASVTRNGDGDYTVLFTANMSSANYVGDVVRFQPLDSARKSA